MTAEKKPVPFNVIRFRGQPDKLQLPSGEMVYKQEKIWVPEYRGFVPVADYLDHFIYAIPDHLAKKYPGSIYRCSCGAPAVISGLSGYVLDASPQGKLFLCLEHSSQGHHFGGSRWI